MSLWFLKGNFFAKHIPALRSTIWSFWHSSINPSMRLANSTTYCIASVILMAHNCHITSRCCWRRKYINIHGYPYLWLSCFKFSYCVQSFFGNRFPKARGFKNKQLASYLGYNDCSQVLSHLLQFLSCHVVSKGQGGDVMVIKAAEDESPCEESHACRCFHTTLLEEEKKGESVTFPVRLLWAWCFLTSLSHFTFTRTFSHLP